MPLHPPGSIQSFYDIDPKVEIIAQGGVHQNRELVDTKTHASCAARQNKDKQRAFPTTWGKAERTNWKAQYGHMQECSWGWLDWSLVTLLVDSGEIANGLESFLGGLVHEYAAAGLSNQTTDGFGLLTLGESERVCIPLERLLRGLVSLVLHFGL